MSTFYCSKDIDIRTETDNDPLVIGFRFSPGNICYGTLNMAGLLTQLEFHLAGVGSCRHFISLVTFGLNFGRSAEIRDI